MYHETQNIIKGEDMIKFLKAQRLSYFGHVQRKSYEVAIKKEGWTPLEGKTRGRLKIKWEEQVFEDFRRMEYRKLKMNEI